MFPHHNDNGDDFYEAEVHDLLLFSKNGCSSEVDGRGLQRNEVPTGRMSRDQFIKACWKTICRLELNRIEGNRPRPPEFYELRPLARTLQEEIR